MFQDGDVIQAFNSSYIRWHHAQQLSLPHKDPLDVNGLRTDGLGRQWLEATSIYRFNRISRKYAIRTDLRDLSQVTVGNPEMNVSRVVNRKLLNPNHRVYGSPYREVWYEGHNFTDATVLDAWARIEGNSLHREINYRDIDLGARVKRDHLVIPVDDFDGLEKARLEAQVESGGRVLQARGKYCPYWSLEGSIGHPVGDIRDRAKVVDVQNEIPRAILVGSK